MKIFIMRHGQAETFAATDELRALTEQGKQETIKMANWLAEKKGVTTFDRVLVSPYLRAKQTWLANQTYLTCNAMSIDESITPYGDCEQVATYLRALIELDSISSLLLISHLPLVAYLCAQLTDGEHAPMFATSAISCIEWDIISGKSQLLWLKTPHDIYT